MGKLQTNVAKQRPRVTVERIVIEEDGTAYRYIEQQFESGVFITRFKLGEFAPAGTNSGAK